MFMKGTPMSKTILILSLWSLPALAQQPAPNPPTQQQILDADQAAITNKIAQWRAAIEGLSGQNATIGSQLQTMTQNWGKVCAQYLADMKVAAVTCPPEPTPPAAYPPK
jgi:hypothetical protein